MNRETTFRNTGRAKVVGLLLLLFSFLSTFSTKAANTLNYTLAHNITMSNGLPSNTVRHIAQDKYGFIWFGTDNGLCRYDGIFIKKYTIPTPDASQYITSLLPLNDNLLVGTNCGPWNYSFQIGQFQQITDKAQDGTSINTEITSFAISQDSIIYIGTEGQGVFSYNPTDKQLVHFKSKATSITKLFVDNDNQLWALVRGSKADSPLLWLNRSRNSFEPMSITNLGDTQLYSLTMLQTRDGSYWLGTWSGGLLRLMMPENQSLSSHTPISCTVASSLPDANHIHTLYELAPDCILVGSDNGVFAFNPQNSSLTPFPSAFNFLLPTVTPPHFIYDIMTDSEGGLWTTSFYDGVHYFSEIPNRFRSFAKQQNSANSLTGNVINHFCEDASGKIWIASDDGGLNLFDPSTHQFIDYPNKAQLSALNVHALSIDATSLWIGTYSNGLYMLNTQTGALQHRENVAGETSAYSILLDSKGNHWIGTMSDVSLISDFNGTPLVHKELGALVIDIDEDPSGNVWFSTHGLGIWRYTPSTRQWQQFFPGRKDKADTTTGTDINCICIDSSNHIYAASGNQLFTYNAKSNRFEEVPLTEILTDISSVIEDQGMLWIATSTSLVSARPKDAVTHYGEGDGVMCGQFMSNAVMRASDGQLFFGSTHGFTSFYPHSIHPNKQALPVYITQMEIYDHDIEDTQKDGSLPLPFAKEIRLSHNDNMITIHFAGLSYVSPSMNRYAYMLEGFDKKWNYTMGEGKAVYTNLSPGTYTFRVKAANNDGVWNEQAATLKITITPPFWWNPIAWLFYLLVIAAMGFYYMRNWKRRQEERHQQEMHELDVKRQSEVRDIQLRFYTTIAHEIRTPVSLIIGPMEALFEKLNNSPSTPITEHRDVLQVVYRNANRLLELVNQLLDFNKVQQGQNVHFALCNVHKLIRNVTDRFVPVLQQQNVTFEQHLPADELNAIIDHEAITKVVSNLMTNARKYTRSKVILTLTSNADTFCITVEDDGMGINKSDMKRIFTPFFQARNNKPGTGIGLSIVKNIVDTHHGDINVESEEGKGSKFIITLPLRQDDAAIGDAVETDNETNVTVAAVHENESADQQNWETSDNTAPILLIVEDDYDMLHFLTDNFKSDYTVITAENGVKGLEQVRRNNVSLIISDWMMPEMDGREFCHHIRSNTATSHIPFVMLTARTDGDSKAEGMECGADAYIEKPFSIKYLNACIKNILEMRRLLFSKFSGHVDTKIEEIAPTPVDNEFLVRINEIIEEHVSDADFNVNVLAQLMGVSRSSLFSKIKSITDVTPNEMIMVVRLRKAATLLLEGQLRVNEVCYKVGFNNPSYFTKCFQKQFGVKPSEYTAQK